MEIVVSYDEFVSNLKKIENVYKQDPSVKGENRVFIMQFVKGLSDESSIIPMFYRTSSIKMCQPLKVKSVLGVLDDTESVNIEFNVPILMEIISSFAKDETQPQKIHINYDSESAFVNLTIFEAPDFKGAEPMNYFFNLPMITPQKFIVDDFQNLEKLNEASYKEIDVTGYREPLLAFIEAYKHVQTKMTQQTYMRMTKDFMYIRTEVGLMTYRNPNKELRDINLVSDSVRMFYVLVHSFDSIELYVDYDNARMFFRLPNGLGVCVLDFRTKYSEDNRLEGIFKLTKASETMVFNRRRLVNNLNRLKKDHTTKFFVRPRGNIKILCMVNTRLEQSQAIDRCVGTLMDNVGFAVQADTLLTSLIPTKFNDDEIVNIHLGLSEQKVLTLGFTDSTKRWYSLVSVQGVLDEDLDKLKEAYEKVKF